MKNILFYTILIGITGLGAVDLGLDIYLKCEALFSNPNPNPEAGIENITNLEVIEDL